MMDVSSMNLHFSSDFEMEMCLTLDDDCSLMTSVELHCSHVEIYTGFSSLGFLFYTQILWNQTNISMHLLVVDGRYWKDVDDLPSSDLQVLKDVMLCGHMAVFNIQKAVMHTYTHQHNAPLNSVSPPFVLSVQISCLFRVCFQLPISKQKSVKRL